MSRPGAASLFSPVLRIGLSAVHLASITKMISLDGNVAFVVPGVVLRETRTSKFPDMNDSNSLSCDTVKDGGPIDSPVDFRMISYFAPSSAFIMTYMSLSVVMPLTFVRRKQSLGEGSQSFSCQLAGILAKFLPPLNESTSVSSWSAVHLTPF